jgi:hypothetical protein
MADELLKGSSGRTLGFIHTTPAGRQEAYDVDRRYQGYHDAEHNLTKDHGGATVAKGNALAALVFGRRWQN